MWVAMWVARRAACAGVEAALCRGGILSVCPKLAAAPAEGAEGGAPADLGEELDPQAGLCLFDQVFLGSLRIAG
jgi:hypothetical protein